MSAIEDDGISCDALDFLCSPPDLRPHLLYSSSSCSEIFAAPAVWRASSTSTMKR